MKYFCELTNMKTGEVLLFNSCAEASDYLKKSKTYVAKCLNRNIPVYGEDKQRYTAAVYKKLKVKAIEAPQPTARKEKASKKANPVKQEKPKDKPPEINRRIQLCCFCKKSCGGCSWSKKFVPVAGWTAVPTIIRNGRGQRDTESYKITACPEYERG